MMSCSGDKQAKSIVVLQSTPTVTRSFKYLAIPFIYRFAVYASDTLKCFYFVQETRIVRESDYNHTSARFIKILRVIS